MVNLLLFIFFGLGLIIGSFLNVVILRYNTQKSFGGRSMCLSCQSKLCWYELIPLFSFFTLKGRCRSCKTKISIQYPLVELATGIVFASLLLKFQGFFFFDTVSFLALYAYYALMFSLLLVIAIYDLRHKIIPDGLAFIFGMFALGGMFFFKSYEFFPHLPSGADFLSGVFVAAPFAALWFFSKGAWMGLGDAKLALGLGWLLGLSLTLSGLVIAFWSGAIVGLIMIAFKKQTMRSEIPFAPFLVFGSFVAFIFQLHLFSTIF